MLFVPLPRAMDNRGYQVQVFSQLLQTRQWSLAIQPPPLRAAGRSDLLILSSVISQLRLQRLEQVCL